MKLLVQAITVSRIASQRICDQIRSWYWRAELQRKGATVGKGFVMRKGAQFSLAPGAAISIGDGVTISENSRILIGPAAQFRLGNNVFIGANSVIAARASIEVGHGSQIAHNVTVIDHDHDRGALAHGNSSSIAAPLAVKIGARVWIAANAMVLKGVTVEDSSIVAAGAIATKSVPSRNLALGRAAENRPLV